MPIRRVEQTKSIGVVLDEHLSWNKHLEHITKKIAYGLGAIRRCRPFVPQTTLIDIYNSLIQSHLDYCYEVWDTIGVTASEKLQKLQNRAARLILRADYNTHSKSLLDQLGWEKLNERRAKQKAVMMYKVRNSSAPSCLTALFKTVAETNSYNLRGSSTKVYLPRPNTEFMKKSFSYDGATTWNKLSIGLHKATYL